MSDVSVLYTVTAVVLGGVALWVVIVLFRAKDAPDESAGPVKPAKKLPSYVDDEHDDRTAATQITRRVVINDETPPPSTTEVAVPSERAVAIAGRSAPVVILPVMRHRLDSHTEIRDDAQEKKEPAATSDPAPAAEVAASPSAEPADEPPPSLSRPPLSIVSAVGKSDPEKGPTERTAIVDRHRLFILADGGGQRVQHELVSAVVVDALAAAFEADSDPTFADPSLPPRADRLRRAVLAADAVLRSRGEGEALDISKVGVLAAHFTPDNRSLYVATSGSDRAYRLRGQEVTQLNKPSLAPASNSDARTVDVVVTDTATDDVYVFGTDAAFLALGDELRTVLKVDPSIDRVAAHFVEAATRGGKSTGMTAIVVRVEPGRPSMRPASPG
jgi:serine/threonine protein phosphatase PrpC